MNRPRPFVVLPFPERRQELVSSRDATRSTNGPIVRALGDPVAKRAKGESAVRFFQDIHGLVHGSQHKSRFVACASGRGVPADQVVR
jgi:hypothetical protein